MTLEENFGRRLRALRRSKDWTQEELATRVQALGREAINRAAVAQFERGVRKVGIGEAVAFAAALDVPFMSLLRPDDADDEMTLAPELTLRAELAFAWLVGETPLTTQGVQMYSEEAHRAHPIMSSLRIAQGLLEPPRDERERQILRAYVAKEQEAYRMAARFAPPADSSPEYRRMWDEGRTITHDQLARLEALLEEEES